MDWKKLLIGGGLTAAAPFTGGGSLAFLGPALAGAGVSTAVGGAFDGGGGDDKPKEKEPDELSSLIESLKGKSADTKAKGKELGGMGTDALAPILNYFKQIMGNDPSAVMAATAPERGRVIDQYDTARKSIATFAPRGGESGSAIANSYTSEAEALSDLTATAKRDATGQAAGLGSTLAGLGLSAEQIASGDLNTIIQAILQQNNLDLTQSGQNKQMAAGLAEGLGTLLGLYLTRGSGGGGSSPAPATP